MKYLSLNIIGELVGIYEGKTCSIFAPLKPHISSHDGGHLMVIPHRLIDERSKLNPLELFEINFLSIIAGKILKRLTGAEWFNYQENGNWLLETDNDRILHLHIYGRKKDAIFQKYGEALSFPLKNDIANWNVKPYSQKEIEMIEQFAIQILNENWTQPFNMSISKMS